MPGGGGGEGEGMARAQHLLAQKSSNGFLELQQLVEPRVAMATVLNYPIRVHNAL